MLNRFVCLALFALLCTCAFAQKTSADEQAIRGLIASIEAGWNAASGVKFAAPFAENADYVVVNGMHIKGRKIIGDAHQGLFTGVYKGSVNKADIKSVRFLRPDVAVALVAWTLKHGQGTNNAMNTMVWVKNNGKWEIEAFHNTPVTPPRG